MTKFVHFFESYLNRNKVEKGLVSMFRFQLFTCLHSISEAFNLKNKHEIGRGAFDSENAYFLVKEIMGVVNSYVCTHSKNPILVLNLSGNRKYNELNEVVCSRSQIVPMLDNIRK